MTMNKSLSYHHYYQISPPILTTKFLSKSSDSLSNAHLKNESEQKQISTKKPKMKHLQIPLIDFEIKPIQNMFISTSALRRRFSLFRMKRSQQSDENSNVHTLQQNIEQLKRDLQIKADELEAMREQIKNKQNGMIQSPNKSIEQAMEIQTMLNARLEDMLVENDLLKNSIQELESFAEQLKCKRKV